MLIITNEITEKKTIIYPIFEDTLIPQYVIDGIGEKAQKLINRTWKSETLLYALNEKEYQPILFVGLGDRESISNEKIKKHLLEIIIKQTDDVYLVLKQLNNQKKDNINLVYYLAENFEIGIYEFTKIAHTSNSKKERKLMFVLEEEYNEVIENALIVSKAVNNARNLGNTPANLMKPVDLANYAINLANDLGVEYEILDKEKLQQIKAGALLAVNQGSSEGAFLIILKYNGAATDPYTALVGKGLTYDSGGYNLKSNGGLGMKYDMCGAATVLSSFEIAVRKHMKVNLYAVIPATENMISGAAYKADDVVISLSGKSIEITNTDAEGRLALCDAITYSQNMGAKTIIDVATLTGAIGSALGDEYTGIFTNNQKFADDFKRASNITNEKVWQMPVDECFEKPLLKSDVADIVNSIRMGGGASVAACFLKYFINSDVSWLHLDIAATATKAKNNVMVSSGATGIMVKTISKFLENM